MQKPKLTPGKAAQLIDAHSLEEKRKRINDVLDTCEKQLEALGCKYMLAALCRDKRDTEGGKVLVNLEANGSDMAVIIQHAFPANKDLAYIGIWVGNEIMRRNKEANITFRDKKRKGKKVVSKDQVVKPGPAPKLPDCGACGAPYPNHHNGCVDDK